MSGEPASRERRGQRPIARRDNYPYYLAGRPVSGPDTIPVLDKYDGTVVARVSTADGAAIEQAISAAVDAREPMRDLAAYERQAVLSHCVQRFSENAELLAQVLCGEAGKPIRDARGEVARLIDTFRIAAEEAVRITGEVLPLDITARARGYSGMWKRVPVGVCSVITPFNFPLNLVAHKLGTGDRRRLPVRAQACQPDAVLLDPARGDLPRPACPPGLPRHVVTGGGAKVGNPIVDRRATSRS